MSLPPIIVVDDFLPDPDAARAHALASEFIDWPAHDGQTYKRVCLTEIPGARKAIEDVCGPVEMLGMGYRLNYGGELPNAAIHSDIGWGTHALVLYLAERGGSGTAFWRHKATGAKRLGIGQADLLDQVKDDWNNQDAWEMESFVFGALNRGLILDSTYFHSRYPFAAFGDGPENGRLIGVAFFTPVDQ